MLLIMKLFRLINIYSRIIRRTQHLIINKRQEVSCQISHLKTIRINKIKYPYISQEIVIFLFITILLWLPNFYPANVHNIRV